MRRRNSRSRPTCNWAAFSGRKVKGASEEKFWIGDPWLEKPASQSSSTGWEVYGDGQSPLQKTF